VTISTERLNELLRHIDLTVCRVSAYENHDPQPVIPMGRHEFAALRQWLSDQQGHGWNLIVQPPPPPGAPVIGLWIFGAWIVRERPAPPEPQSYHPESELPGPLPIAGPLSPQGTSTDSMVGDAEAPSDGRQERGHQGTGAALREDDRTGSHPRPDRHCRGGAGYIAAYRPRVTRASGRGR